jgi:hypothetical protein
MTKQEFKQFREHLFIGLNQLIENKNTDYASKDSAFACFEASEELGISAIKGLCVRILDKIERLKTYSRTGMLAVKNEGVEDIFKDLIGYSVIALAMLEERKHDRR